LRRGPSSRASRRAERADHIPESVHLSIDLLRTGEGTLKSADELWQLFQEYGVVPERSVVTYCTIGIRASEAALVLSDLLGFPDARLYYGSWAEWGTRADTPIETQVVPC
jgi:thiosulfate/3-mercaptopyruvate sulfurtransferase